MKLLTRTSLYYFFALAIVMALGGILFFFAFRALVEEEVMESLYREKDKLSRYVMHVEAPIAESPLQDVRIQPVSTLSDNVEISERFVFDVEEGEELPYRVLRFYAAGKNGQYYEITVSKPGFEADDLIETTGLLLLALAIGLLLTMLALNVLLAKRLWRPFHSTLQNLADYKNPQDKLPLGLKTGTTEFDALNQTLLQMQAFIAAEFVRLKEFTENAAHELQTPLAVIMAKSEMLMQTGQLNSEQSELLGQVQAQAQRLSKINQALLLLAKIENRQFADVAPLDFSALLLARTHELSELFPARELQLEMNVAQAVMLPLHPHLAEVMLNNLLGNALRHTDPGGMVRVRLHSGGLSVSNSGIPFPVPGERLFERFFKLKTDSGSMGLGLAIVESIAKEAGYRFGYQYKAGQHVFFVDFHPKP